MLVLDAVEGSVARDTLTLYVAFYCFCFSFFFFLVAIWMVIFMSDHSGRTWG